jgi:hypothetical protein
LLPFSQQDRHRLNEGNRLRGRPVVEKMKYLGALMVAPDLTFCGKE